MELELHCKKWPFDPVIQEWSSGNTRIAWAQHRPAQVGGVNYAVSDGAKFALFAGRPIVWRGDNADGQSTLDPRFYLAPTASWLADLDGRYAIVRFDGTLEVIADKLGSYAVFEAEHERTKWYSNSAALLASIVQGGLDRSAVAHLVSCGFPAMGNPLWAGVKRLPPRLDKHEIARMFGKGLDGTAAARDLAEVTRALMDWPGRISTSSATGGKDSRLVLSAAARANLPLVGQTVAFPDQAHFPRTDDVVVGEAMCKLVGVPHTTLLLDQRFGLYRTPEEVVATMRATTAGMPYNDASTIRFEHAEGVLPILLSGAGGELSRSLYGYSAETTAAGMARYMFEKTAFTWPTPVLSDEGQNLVIAELTSWAQEWLDAGIDPADIPDAFFLFRLHSWAAFSSAPSESHEDFVAPLWSYRMLKHMFGATRHQRVLNSLHRQVMTHLNPSLAKLPFEPSKPGWPQESAIARKIVRTKVLVLKAKKLLWRKVRAATDTAPTYDPFPKVHALAKSRLDHVDPIVWSVIDRSKVASLLNQNPAGMQIRSRYQVARLAAIF